MQQKKVIEHIVSWLTDYSKQSGTKGFIIGISGGIDSAVTSTLCALTGKRVICVNMPIHQRIEEFTRGQEHIEWLCQNFKNVSSVQVELTSTFESFRSILPGSVAEHQLAMANTRARIRMTTLYAIGQSEGLLVAGTGNKVEDFGVGFYTKYGDGGVDLSPIADLKKTQVFQIGKELGLVKSILVAKPTDGLWGDGRSDEDQIGASYPELEWAMDLCMNMGWQNNQDPIQLKEEGLVDMTDHQLKVLRIYVNFHNANLHKMRAIPICEIPRDLLETM